MNIGIQTWGSDGDILPFVALAGGLRSAGNQVTLVITSVDGKDYRSLGERLDVRVKHVGGPAYDRKDFAALANEIGYERNPLKQFDLIVKRMFEPFVDEMYSASKALCEENGLLIGHVIHYPLQAAARKAGLPYVTVNLSHMGIPTGFRPPSGMPNLGRLMNLLQWKLVMNLLTRRAAPAMNRFREGEGLPPVRSVREVWESRLMNLLAVGSVFCEGFPDWEDHHRVSGFLALPEEAPVASMPEGLEDFIASGPPPVYMTFGSMASELHDTEYVKTTIKLMTDAARLAGTRAIIQSCWHAVSGIEESPHIYRTTRVPHHAVFPRCSAIVHHGGAGTTHSSLRSGRPSVVVAHIADQTFWGGELRRLGVAPRPLHRVTVTAGKLAARIRSVLVSPSMKMWAERYGERLREEDGVGNAVRFIEECRRTV
jgi:UDP:flavonoid glycosyltransferase YjiC (YdhE family)